MVSFKEKPPSFFKIFFFEFSSKLRIPPEFVKRNGEMLPQTSSFLQTESGKSWDVKIKLLGQHFYLTDGWPDFVKDNHIAEKDFLVFHLVHKSTFQVSIYGVEGCPKEYSSPISPNSQRSGKGAEFLPNTEPEEENCDGGGQLSEIRSFQVVVKKHSKYTMDIPKSLAKKTGIARKRAIKLQNEEGKEWAVGINVRRDDGRIRMTRGWNEFRQENQLVIGSKCWFEFDAASEILIMKKEGKFTSINSAIRGRRRPPKSLVIC